MDNKNAHIAGRYTIIAALIASLTTIGGILLNEYFDFNKENSKKEVLNKNILKNESKTNQNNTERKIAFSVRDKNYYEVDEFEYVLDNNSKILSLVESNDFDDDKLISNRCVSIGYFPQSIEEELGLIDSVTIKYCISKEGDVVYLKLLREDTSIKSHTILKKITPYPATLTSYSSDNSDTHLIRCGIAKYGRKFTHYNVEEESKEWTESYLKK
jgi:hypothetical protein